VGAAPFSVEQAARLYSVPLIEYPGCAGGVLLSSGCGIMLGVMDQLPLRWCSDVDQMPDAQRSRLPEFMQMASASGLVAVCGWFSHHSPEALREGVARLGPKAPCYAGHKRFGLWWESPTLAHFIEQVRSLLGTAPASP